MQQKSPSRQWLRTLVGGLALVAVLEGVHAAGSNPAAQTAPAKASPKVIVLGAGMSGVMAANTLYEKGFKDITIIEANDYIGGRMKAGAIGGRKIELGANWIHGVGGNPIFDIAANKKLNLVETNWSQVVHLPMGADPNEEEEVERFEKAFEKTEERAKRYRDTGKKDLNVVDAMRYEGWVAKTPLEKALLFNEMDNDMGPADRTSFELAMNIATYNKDDHDMFVIDSKGYSSLAYDMLAKNFPNPLNNKNVVLKTKVDKISYTDKGVTIGATTDGKNVTYNADYVITTFSAGVLRNKALQMFVPTLPEDKMDAIFRVDMTLFLKVFVETTENFWADDTNGAESWIFADEVRGNFTSWLDLTLPKLGANYAVPANGTYLSMCMIASDFAAQMEKLTNDQLKDEVIKAMRAMFPKAAGRINTKTVASVVMNKWGQDDLFSGSWSNPARDFTKADFAKLGEPVGRVYFSGEHTSAEYFGYVHGAYRAGIETANQLLKRPEFK